MTIYDRLKCLFSQNCWKKSCSVMSWIFWKKIFVITCLIWTDDVIFGPKRRLFGQMWQKWLILTVMNAFWAKNAGEKVDQFKELNLLKNFFGHFMSNLYLWRHIWLKNTTFWQNETKMTNFDGYECLLSQKCWGKID